MTSSVKCNRLVGIRQLIVHDPDHADTEAPQNRKQLPLVGEHSPICTHGAHYLLTAHLPLLILAPFLHRPLSPLYRSPHTPLLGPR